MKHPLFVSSLLLLVPSIAVAATTFTPEEIATITKPCLHSTDERSEERCKARLLEHAEIGNYSRVLPTDAISLYQSMDFGWSRRQLLLEQRRRSRIENRLGPDGYKTYGQFTPEDNVNTVRATYLNDLQQQRLDCMTKVWPGRARKLCLEGIAQDARSSMTKIFKDAHSGALLR